MVDTASLNVGGARHTSNNGMPAKVVRRPVGHLMVTDMTEF